MIQLMVHPRADRKGITVHGFVCIEDAQSADRIVLCN